MRHIIAGWKSWDWEDMALRPQFQGSTAPSLSPWRSGVGISKPWDFGHGGSHRMFVSQSCVGCVCVCVCVCVCRHRRKEDKKRYEEALSSAREAAEARQRDMEEDWRREKEALRKAHDKQVRGRALQLVRPQV